MEVSHDRAAGRGAVDAGGVVEVLGDDDPAVVFVVLGALQYRSTGRRRAPPANSQQRFWPPSDRPPGAGSAWLTLIDNCGRVMWPVSGPFGATCRGRAVPVVATDRIESVGGYGHFTRSGREA